MTDIICPCNHPFVFHSTSYGCDYARCPCKHSPQQVAHVHATNEVLSALTEQPTKQEIHYAATQLDDWSVPHENGIYFPDATLEDIAELALLSARTHRWNTL